MGTWVCGFLFTSTSLLMPFFFSLCVRRSSSSIWYELSFSETHGLVRRGDIVWQIAFGSGFKCNSAIWRARRTIHDTTRRTLWAGVEGLAPQYQTALDAVRARAGFSHDDPGPLPTYDD
jgi:hypothetical protein